MAQAETTIDVLIVGAGLSGIGAAAHLTMQCPNKSYAIVEQRADMGGTWDLFRYPGIRSDSDMHTLGYRFKPWLHEKTIADGPSIHEYVHETADEYGISPHIHFGHKVISANWSSAVRSFFASIGSSRRILRRISGAKLGTPRKFRFSPSVSVSPMRKMP